MTAGARLYMQWLEELTFHGVLSLLDHSENLDTLAARMTDHQLPAFSRVILEIKTSLNENEYEFAYISQQLIHLSLISQGIIKIDKLPHNIQWHAITAAGLNITKKQLERYETERQQALYVISTEVTRDVDVPYQKVWFTDGEQFYMYLEYSFQGEFKKKFYPQKTYQLAYYSYPDSSLYRIYINEQKSIDSTNPFKSIPSLSESISDLQTNLKTYPYTYSFPIIFTYSNADEKYIYPIEEGSAIMYQASEMMEEILRLSTYGIAFGEFRKGVFCLLSIVVEGELINGALMGDGGRVMGNG